MQTPNTKDPAALEAIAESTRLGHPVTIPYSEAAAATLLAACSSDSDGEDYWRDGPSARPGDMAWRVRLVRDEVSR